MTRATLAALYTNVSLEIRLSEHENVLYMNMLPAATAAVIAVIGFV